MKNHRGETVIKGDPTAGTYRFISNTTHECMLCDRTINAGEEAEEDFVTVCADCYVEFPVSLRWNSDD